MAIPPATDDFEKQRFYAKTLREGLMEIQKNLSDAAQKDFNVLSIGMSEDLEAALIEGATHIRIGTAIFGKRANKA